MVVASGSIAGKIFDDQFISLQGCRLNFRVGSQAVFPRPNRAHLFLGVEQTKSGRNPTSAQGCPVLGAKQTCRGGGSDGKS